MIFGRFVYGLGGEALSVTVGTLLVAWFKGNELSFSSVKSRSKLRFDVFIGIQSQFCQGRKRTELFNQSKFCEISKKNSRVI